MSRRRLVRGIDEVDAARGVVVDRRRAHVTAWKLPRSFRAVVAEAVEAGAVHPA